MVVTVVNKAQVGRETRVPKVSRQVMRDVGPSHLTSRAPPAGGLLEMKLRSAGLRLECLVSSSDPVVPSFYLGPTLLPSARRRKPSQTNLQCLHDISMLLFDVFIR
jgi:hypothetical protein